MKIFFTVFVITFFALNSTLIDINNKQLKQEKKMKKINKWEEISNTIILVILLCIFIILICKVHNFSKIFTAIFYTSCLLTYCSILFNVMLKGKDAKVSDIELKALMLIPMMGINLYAIVEKNIEDIILISNKVDMYILVNIIKYFVLYFFVAMDIFIFLKEITIYIKSKRKSEIKKLEIRAFDMSEYEYINSRGKSGIEFVRSVYKRYNNCYMENDI